MKQRICFLLCAIGAVIAAKAQDGFVLRTKFKNPKNYTIGIAYVAGDSYVIDTSSKMENGWAVFRGKVKDPLVASLFVRGNPATVIATEGGFIPGPGLSFFLSNDVIAIEGDADAPYSANVKGGQANNEWNKIRGKLQELEGTGWVSMKKGYELAATGDSSGLAKSHKLRSDNEEKKAKLMMDFIKKNPSSAVSMYFLTSFMNTLPIEELSAVYAQLGDTYKSNMYGKAIAAKIESVNATAIGKTAIPIQKKDKDGNPVNLETLKGKYVLIDFWGSWCGPCRQGHPHMKELYAQYRDRGFEIVGIAHEQRSSQEDNRRVWLDAVEKDGIPWIQVLNNEDIAGFDAVKAYGVTAFPTKILLDKEGKIIARYVGDEEALDKKLEEIFGK